MSHRIFIGFVALLSITFIHSSLDAQQRQGNKPGERVRGSGKIAGVRPGFLYVIGEGGEQWIVKVHAKPQDISFVGTAEPSWLSRGMLVRFTAKLDKRGEASDPVSDLTVFTLREGIKVGVFPDAGLGSNNLFGGDPSDQAQKSRQPSRGKSSEASNYLVAGALTGVKDNKIAVTAGGVAVKAELAPGAKINVEIADYRFAQKGDGVQFEGWALPNQKSQIVANRVTVSAAETLTGTKQDSRKRGSANKAPKPKEAPAADGLNDEPKDAPKKEKP